MWFSEIPPDHHQVVPCDRRQVGSIGAERLGVVQVVDVGTCGRHFLCTLAWRFLLCISHSLSQVRDQYTSFLPNKG